jgi:hypothetical protein
MKHRRVLSLLLLLAAPASYGATVKADPDSPIAQTMRSLEVQSNGQGSDLLSDSPATRQLLDELSAQEESFVLASIKNTNDTSEIHPGFARFSYINFTRLTFTIERIGREDFIASTDSDVLLISHRKIIWSARREAAKSAARLPFLKAWSDDAKFTLCQERSWGECGRIGVSFGLLPDGKNGHHRFILDGIYRRDKLAVLEHQFSVWEWNGAEVKPLLGSMIAAGQEDELFTFGENLIRVPILLQRPVESVGLASTSWVIRVTPAGIKDLGTGVIPPEGVKQEP